MATGSRTEKTSQRIHNEAQDSSYLTLNTTPQVETVVGSTVGRVTGTVTGAKTAMDVNLVAGDMTESKDMEGGGKVSVGTTAVEATFTGTTQAITIAADYDNEGTLYVGKSNVANDGSNALTFLLPGDSVELSYNDVDNAVYVVSDTATQNFWKGAIL